MTTLIAFLIATFLAATGFFFYAQQPSVSPVDSESEHETQMIPALTSRDRSGQNLTTMPTDILAMNNLQQLDLSNNMLTGALPAEIRHLQNLQILDISNNKMTGLPAELGQLSKLRVLDASNNQLTGIPHELGNLQNLEVLDLSGNDISEQDLHIIRDKLPKTTRITL